MMIYFPRIDHTRRQALRVERFPGAKVCARISVTTLRARIPNPIPAGPPGASR